MAQLNAAIGVVNFYVQWPQDATLTLIEERRLYQQLFCSTPIHE
jgi:hypothetical protein